MAEVRTDTVPRQRDKPAEEKAVTRRQARDPGGRTVVGTDIIEKIAARAVREVAGTRAARSRPAKARVSGTVVLLRLRVAVDYPMPVARTAALIREHVRDRVEFGTGKQVHHIDIEIAELVR